MTICPPDKGRSAPDGGTGPVEGPGQAGLGPAVTMEAAGPNYEDLVAAPIKKTCLFCREAYHEDAEARHVCP